MISVRHNEMSDLICQVWNGDDMMGQQIILKKLYVEQLRKMQPHCEYLEQIHLILL
jgi:hypothetical protein